MRKEIIKGINPITKTASTFFEFVEMAKGSPIDGSGSSSASRSSDSFYGDATSFEDMYAKCYSGYHAKEVSARRVEMNSGLKTKEVEPIRTFIGESLDLGAYASGNPLCFEQEQTDSVKPRFHMLFSTNAVCGVDADSFLNHGAAMCSLADQVSADADVKISLYITNINVLNGKGCQMVLLKDYEETIDVPRIGAVGHPSFFRRIGFRWFENADTLIDPSCESGYGCSQTGRDRKEVISDADFYAWARVDADEFAIDCAAPDISAFESVESATEWVNESVLLIKKAIENGESSIQLFQ